MAFDPTNPSGGAPWWQTLLGMGSPGGAVQGGLQGGGLLGSSLNNPLFNFGAGLLARTGPSLVPQSPWQAIGAGLQNIGEGQERAMETDLRREAILSAQQERTGNAQLQKWISENPSATDEQLMSAAMQFRPDMAMKARLSSVVDPATRSTLNLQSAQLADIQAKATERSGGVIAQTTSTLGDISTLAKISQRLEGSPIFKTGGFVDRLGLGGNVAATLQAAQAAGVPVDQRHIDDATDLGILDKATTSLGVNLQSVASNLPRSGYAMEQMQTAIAAKMPWVAKRATLIPNLRAIFADIDEQGLGDKVPAYNDMKKFLTVLEEQQTAYDERRAAQTTGVAGTSGEVAPQPASEVNTPHPAQKNIPQRTPAPAVTKITTKNFGINPLTNQPVPKYNDVATADRDTSKLKAAGIKHVLVKDRKTGIEYLYGVE